MTRCPVSQAEIDNDTPKYKVIDRSVMNQEIYGRSESQEQCEQDLSRWNDCVEKLLNGEKIEVRGMNLSLENWMSKNHVLFARFNEIHFDFMEAFKMKMLRPEHMDLIKQEAKTLASIIVG